MFESLDFVYVSAADVDAATMFHVESRVAELLVVATASPIA
jgi:hypothetical protein